MTAKSQLRGLKRELGLALRPSQAARQEAAIEERPPDPIASRIKLS
jgi:hypothetical protein